MKMTEPLTANAIRTTPEHLVITLPEREARLPWSRCPTSLAKAPQAARLQAELPPSGCGIHWPLLDEGWIVAGLIAMAGN